MTAKSFKIIIFALSVCLVAISSEIKAQIGISGHVYIKTPKAENKSQFDQEPCPSAKIYLFNKYSSAQKIAKQKNEMALEGETKLPVSQFGEFSTGAAMVDGGILVMYLDPDENEPKMQAVKITSKQKDQVYDVVFTRSEIQQIKQVDITAKIKGPDGDIVEETPIDDGESLSWGMTLKASAKLLKNDTRIFFQPYAVDCENDDTVQYIKPATFDANLYHDIQQRRMIFDFDTHDPVSTFYDGEAPIVPGEDFTYSWSYSMPKPDANRNYKCASHFLVEDYNHVVWKLVKQTGSCFTLKPWKFLDVSFAQAEMDLHQKNAEGDEEFMEPEHIVTRDYSQEIHLKFEVGKTILTDDSINVAEKEQISKDLKRHGKMLMQCSIMASSSPEGDYDHNKALARDRGQVALSLIRPYIGSDVVLIQEEPKVFSWDDVARQLDEDGKGQIADQLHQCIEEHKGASRSALEAAVKDLISYETHIVPVMERMRAMKFTYKVKLSGALKPEEAVDYFFHHPEYEFNSRDYFNLFDYFEQRKDTVNLKKLTDKAWEYQTSFPNYQDAPFSAYVANKKAIFSILSDEPDTNLLLPFVNKFGKILNQRRQKSWDNPTMITINRTAHVMNQALMYFKCVKLGNARHLVKLLQSALPANDPYRNKGFQDLVHFINLETTFHKKNKTPEEQRDADEALKYVMQTSLLNRAILKTELRTFLGIKPEEAMATVDSLPDNIAKKWYLKGMLSSLNAAKPTIVSADGLVKPTDPSTKFTDIELMQMPTNDPDRYDIYLKEDSLYQDSLAKYNIEMAKLGPKFDELGKIPDYLCYFQRSFDLEPSYMKFYATEAAIPIDVRESKKMKYNIKKVPLYREKFNYLLKERDKKIREAEEKALEEAEKAQQEAEAITTPEIPQNTQEN